MIYCITEHEVYQLAYQQAMELFDISKTFPDDEKYGLTSQIRRSSRSVAMNLREAWAKRRYELHLTSKLTDCDGENAETSTAIDFARDCKYIDQDTFANLQTRNRKIGRHLGSMINNPKNWTIKS